MDRLECVMLGEPKYWTKQEVARDCARVGIEDSDWIFVETFRRNVFAMMMKSEQNPLLRAVIFAKESGASGPYLTLAVMWLTVRESVHITVDVIAYLTEKLKSDVDFIKYYHKAKSKNIEMPRGFETDFSVVFGL